MLVVDAIRKCHLWSHPLRCAILAAPPIAVIGITPPLQPSWRYIATGSSINRGRSVNHQPEADSQLPAMAGLCQRGGATSLRWGLSVLGSILELDRQREVQMMNEHAGEQEGLSAEELARRTRWFEQYVEALNQRSVVAEAGGEPYACPCCRHPTLEGRGQFEICFACGWEDDGQDDEDADTVRGGPNGFAEPDGCPACLRRTAGQPGRCAACLCQTTSPLGRAQTPIGARDDLT
ncbi:CPCC family cysteine-rich protein [Micromonospora chalcea]